MKHMCMNLYEWSPPWVHFLQSHHLCLWLMSSCFFISKTMADSWDYAYLFCNQCLCRRVRLCVTESVAAMRRQAKDIYLVLVNSQSSPHFFSFSPFFSHSLTHISLFFPSPGSFRGDYWEKCKHIWWGHTFTHSYTPHTETHVLPQVCLWGKCIYCGCKVWAVCVRVCVFMITDIVCSCICVFFTYMEDRLQS